MSPRTNLRTELLRADTSCNDGSRNYEQELKQMVVRELTNSKKSTLLIAAVTSVGMICLFLYLLLTQIHLPWLARGMFVVGIVFSARWLVMIVSVLRRGSIDLKSVPRQMAQSVWTFTILLVTVLTYFGMSDADKLKGLQLIGFGLVFLVCAAVYWLSYRIEAAELTTKERLLELELRLVESGSSEKHA